MPHSKVNFVKAPADLVPHGRGPPQAPAAEKAGHPHAGWRAPYTDAQGEKRRWPRGEPLPSGGRGRLQHAQEVRFIGAEPRSGEADAAHGRAAVWGHGWPRVTLWGMATAFLFSFGRDGEHVATKILRPFRSASKRRENEKRRGMDAEEPKRRMGR